MHMDATNGDVEISCNAIIQGNVTIYDEVLIECQQLHIDGGRPGTVSADGPITSGGRVTGTEFSTGTPLTLDNGLGQASRITNLEFALATLFDNGTVI